MNPAIRRNPHKKIKHNKQIAPIVQPVAKVVESPTETLEETLSKIEPPEEILTEVEQPLLNKDEELINDLTDKLAENFKSSVQAVETEINNNKNLTKEEKIEFKKAKDEVVKKVSEPQKKGKPGRKGK